jgi:hypothetical protein
LRPPGDPAGRQAAWPSSPASGESSDSVRAEHDSPESPGASRGVTPSIIIRTVGPIAQRRPELLPASPPRCREGLLESGGAGMILPEAQKPIRFSSMAALGATGNPSPVRWVTTGS